MEAKKFEFYDSEWSTQLESIIQDTVLRAVEDLLAQQEKPEWASVHIGKLSDTTWKVVFTRDGDVEAVESIRMVKEVPWEGTEAE